MKKMVKKAVEKIVNGLGYDISIRRKSPSFVDESVFIRSSKENAEKLQSLGIDKAHYGGVDFGDGWVNVDLWGGERNKTFVRADLTSKHPFHSNFFRFSFAQDFMEHLDQAESIVFLSEAFRALKVGGVLRLSFPGLKGVLRRHYNSAGYEGAALGRKEAYTMWEHKHFYSEESLETVARHIGFSKIEFVKYGESKYEELRHLDSRPDQKDLNIYVELTK